MNLSLPIRLSPAKNTLPTTPHPAHQENYDFSSLSWSAFTEEAIYTPQVARAGRHRSFFLTDLPNSPEASFSIRRLLSSRAESQRVKEDDISDYVPYDDDEEDDNESSMFDSTNYSDEAFSDAFWDTLSTFIPDNEDIISEFEDEKEVHVTRNSNELEKTKYILGVMSRFRISLIKFFVTAMRSNTRTARTFANKLHEEENSDLFKGLMIRKNKAKEDRLKVLEIIDWQTMLRREIVSLSSTAFFGKFDVREYLGEPRYRDLQTVVEEVLQPNAPLLLSALHAVMAPARKQSHRGDPTRRLITIFAIICFTYKPYTCTNWPMQFALQFHAHGTKIRVLGLGYQAGINSGYNAVLKVIKLIQRHIAKEMVTRGRSSRHWTMVYDNIEITMGVREQRLDSIKRFISWTTAQQIVPATWPANGIHQHMYHPKTKLKSSDLVSHSHLDISKDVHIQVGIFPCFHHD